MEVIEGDSNVTKQLGKWKKPKHAISALILIKEIQVYTFPGHFIRYTWSTAL